MEDSLFQFKKFSVRHSRSSMKVGVDGVLIGAWAKCTGEKILDVGTGCGLIALMMAQRNLKASIDAIDVDTDSINEAKMNFNASPWSRRLSAYLKDFEELSNQTDIKYDVIVSNPPFFDSGLNDIRTPRERARHIGNLSPGKLIIAGGKILKENGYLSMIIPLSSIQAVKTFAVCQGLKLTRECFVRNNEKAPVKRVILEFIKTMIQPSITSTDLILFREKGLPTEDYRILCKDFYLKF